MALVLVRFAALQFSLGIILTLTYLPDHLYALQTLRYPGLALVEIRTMEARMLLSAVVAAALWFWAAPLARMLIAVAPTRLQAQPNAD